MPTLATSLAMYLDPGSGSLLLQALLAGFAGLVVFARTLGRRWRARLGSRAPAEETSRDAPAPPRDPGRPPA